MKNFWENNAKGKTEVYAHLIIQFLESNGFKNANINGQIKLVHINNNIVRVLDDNIEVRQFLIAHIKRCISGANRNFVIDLTIKQFKEIKSSRILDAIETIGLSFVEDTENTTYKFFNNCVVEVTAELVKVLDYSELKDYVLIDDVIKHDFNLVKEGKIHESVFPNFLFRCMNLKEVNYYSLMTIIGYLSSKHKVKKYNKAVIFCDENQSDIAEGGTGKSLTAEGLSHFNKSVFEDGKNFKAGHFTYQQINIGTRLFIIDDTNKKFNFESLFSSITNGFQVEKKYQAKYSLSFKDSPKILISTNYTIFGRGFSFERRVVEIEFSNYYGRDRSPREEFGKDFFDDWDNEEWNLFFGFMLECVKLYHASGIIETQYSNSEIRRLRRETNLEFIEFISDYEFANYKAKADLFEEFIKEYPDYNKWLTIRSFNNWVKRYFEIKKIDYKELKKNGGQRSWIFK